MSDQPASRPPLQSATAGTSGDDDVTRILPAPAWLNADPEQTQVMPLNPALAAADPEKTQVMPLNPAAFAAADPEKTQMMPLRPMPAVPPVPAAAAPGLDQTQRIPPPPSAEAISPLTMAYAPTLIQSPPTVRVPPPPQAHDGTLVQPAPAAPGADPAAAAPGIGAGSPASITGLRGQAPSPAVHGSAPTGNSTLPRDPAAPDGSAANPGTLPAVSASAQATTGIDGQVRQVGRYLIQGKLGRGGMATVYRAHDPQIGRDVAIKFLHASLSEDDECRIRFLRESRAAGSLSHPNIVVVHDVGEIEHRPYMAMELIDGLPLSDVLEKTRTLPVRDVVVMGLQLARALEYAHSRGIVHRDIKPGNMMLLKGTQTIKVTDFGIAHMDDGRDDARTQVGAVLGTPQYMSPEQARGEKLDGRSDLFSAGIVMYQLLAGERPFRGDSLVAVATRIVNEEAPPLNAKRPEVPASLRRVIDRCLAKQPAQRWQSGKELAEALTKVLAEIDETAREKDKPRIVPLRVKWAATMAAIVAVVMGLTATVITQRQYAAMMGQVSDYGASLARFIAQQNAANVLGDDWDAVDVALQEIMKTRNFERVSVIDLQGVVRATSVPALLGKPYTPEGAEALGKLGGSIAATRYASGGQSVLGFEAPVLFQDKQVGRVALGIPEAPLTQVAQLSITLMVVLALVTVLAVAIAMYFVANWFAKPIRLVSESMAEIGKGRFDHRINEPRNDEFGLLFAAFDAMAQALQQRAVAGTGPSPATLPPGTQPPDTLLPGMKRHPTAPLAPLAPPATLAPLAAEAPDPAAHTVMARTPAPGAASAVTAAPPVDTAAPSAVSPAPEATPAAQAAVAPAPAAQPGHTPTADAPPAGGTTPSA